LTAFCWGLALVPSAWLLPAYQGSASSSSGVVTHTSATLVGENGLWVLGIVAPPAVLALIAWFGLHRRCASTSRRGGALAWTAIAALLVLSLLAAASVGPFLLPVALLLVAAARLTPAG
jgi:energy-converting hydrogenase Eha subunit B